MALIPTSKNKLAPLILILECSPTSSKKVLHHLIIFSWIIPLSSKMAPPPSACKHTQDSKNFKTTINSPLPLLPPPVHLPHSTKLLETSLPSLLSQIPHPSHLQANLAGILPHCSTETSHLMPLTIPLAALILFDLLEATDSTEHSLPLETHSSPSFCVPTFSSSF